MAAVRIAGKALRTPIIENPALNELVGGRVLIKPECLQRTGSFKFRGAFNRISQLGLDAREGGVVAYSSGNHAQGVAMSAAHMNISALIVMPATTPTNPCRLRPGLGWLSEVRSWSHSGRGLLRCGQGRGCIADFMPRRSNTFTGNFSQKQVASS